MTHGTERSPASESGARLAQSEKKFENNPMHSRKPAGRGSYGFYEISLDPSGKSGVYCHHRKGWDEPLQQAIRALQVVMALG